MNNKVKGDVKMTKIKIMSVRDEDMPYIKAWAEKHHVEVDITKEALTDDNVEVSLVMMAYRYHNKYHYQSMFIND